VSTGGIRLLQERNDVLRPPAKRIPKASDTITSAQVHEKGIRTKLGFRSLQMLLAKAPSAAGQTGSPTDAKIWEEAKEEESSYQARDSVQMAFFPIRSKRYDRRGSSGTTR